MKVTGSYESFLASWPSPTKHANPILYTVTPQGKISSIFPIAGQAYEWVLDSGAPSEGDFLGTYGYAHKVTGVNP